MLISARKDQHLRISADRLGAWKGGGGEGEKGGLGSWKGQDDFITLKRPAAKRTHINDEI